MVQIKVIKFRELLQQKWVRFVYLLLSRGYFDSWDAHNGLCYYGGMAVVGRLKYE